jgi:mono/diheme cytochrome c family protein
VQETHQGGVGSDLIRTDYAPAIRTIVTAGDGGNDPSCSGGRFIQSPAVRLARHPRASLRMSARLDAASARLVGGWMNFDLNHAKLKRPSHNAIQIHEEATVQKASLAIVTLVIASLNTTAFAQKPKAIDEGKQAYETQCAICHGLDGKGNGPYAASLKVPAPDLTTLAQKNGGVFPVDRVTKVIDGRTGIAAHGSRDMPIWGTRFAVNAAEHFVDVPYDQEAYIRGQILALIDYLNRLQQK